MRFTLAILLSVALTGAGVAAADGEKRPPARLVFHSKAGDVLFNHRAHAAREKRECGVCHDELWPASTARPLASSAGCRTCHRADGKAFDMKGNCQKCHPGNGGNRAPG
jgi:c(7)-type cytochrome triheme protein